MYGILKCTENKFINNKPTLSKVSESNFKTNQNKRLTKRLTHL